MLYCDSPNSFLFFHLFLNHDVCCSVYMAGVFDSYWSVVLLKLLVQVLVLVLIFGQVMLQGLWLYLSFHFWLFNYHRFSIQLLEGTWLFWLVLLSLSVYWSLIAFTRYFSFLWCTCVSCTIFNTNGTHNLFYSAVGTRSNFILDEYSLLLFILYFSSKLTTVILKI
jgi:hypothetical protein